MSEMDHVHLSPLAHKKDKIERSCENSPQLFLSSNKLYTNELFMESCGGGGETAPDRLFKSHMT